MEKPLGLEWARRAFFIPNLDVKSDFNDVTIFDDVSPVNNFCKTSFFTVIETVRAYEVVKGDNIAFYESSF